MTEPSERDVDAAITALTAAATSTTSAGGPVDFADLIARVLAAVTANVGGIDTLLAGRPGSWEADLVRQLVVGTSGRVPWDELRARTAPLMVELDVDEVFERSGLQAKFDEAASVLDARASAQDAATFDRLATAEERAQHARTVARIEELQGDSPEVIERRAALRTSAAYLWSAVLDRSPSRSGDPVGALARVEAVRRAVADTYRRQWVWGVEMALRAQDVHCAVHVAEADDPTVPAQVFDKLRGAAAQYAPVPSFTVDYIIRQAALT